MHTSASVHGKLLGGGVAFALAADYCTCSVLSTFNFGNLPRGVNPIFMFSRALTLTTDYPTSYSIYVENAYLTSNQASAYGLVDEVMSDRAEAKHVAVQKYCTFEQT